MHVLRLLVLAVLANLAAPPILSAQLYIPAGSRVRATFAERQRPQIVARFVARRGDTLVLERDSVERVSISLANLARLESSQGVHGHGWLGAGIGLVAGAVVGLAVGAAMDDPSDCRSALSCGFDELDDHYDTMGGVIFGGLIGVAAGAVIGANIRTERWVQHPLPGPARHATRIAPSRRGLALVARVAVF